MNILLVVPRYQYTNKANFIYYFPLGLGYISSTLKQAGYNVTCYNANHYDGDIKDLITEQLNKKKFDIVCTGHTTRGYTIVKGIMEAAREHKSKPKIIIGGSLPTSELDVVKYLKPDYAVLGEGETSILELLECIKKKKNPKNVAGIAYLKKGKLLMTKPRDLIQDLDAIPPPDFEGLEFEKTLGKYYSNSIGGYNSFDEPRVYPIICSRGCPYNCTFCYHSLGRRYRTRSIKDVMKELKKNIKKYKINTINFHDDLFSINMKRLKEICIEIKKLKKSVPWDIKWICQLSLHTVTDEMLDMLRDAGCDLICYGFESYSQKVLRSMKKPITPKMIADSVKKARKAKMSLQGGFIFGDRAETVETAKETLDYWKKHSKGQLRLGFIAPYPRSEMYLHCLRKGIIKDKMKYIEEEVSLDNAFFYNMTDNMTDKEFKKLRHEVRESFEKYNKFVIPNSITKEKGKNGHTVKVSCPYCRKKNIYKNYYISDAFPDNIYFSNSMSCRKCNMRYNVCSPLRKLANQYFPVFKPFLRLYTNVQEFFLRRKMRHYLG